MEESVLPMLLHAAIARRQPSSITGGSIVSACTPKSAMLTLRARQPQQGQKRRPVDDERPLLADRPRPRGSAQRRTERLEALAASVAEQTNVNS